LSGGDVKIEDSYGRSSLTVATSKGSRKTVKLEGGKATVPLSSL